MYRVRQDHNGNLDYDFNFDYADGARTPRDSQRIDELAADFQNLSPGSNYEAQDYALDSGQQERHRSSKPKGKERERERDRERVKDRDRDKDKSKDKSKDKIKGKDKDKDRTKHQHHDKHHRKDYSDSSKSHLEQLGPSTSSRPESQAQAQCLYDPDHAQYCQQSGYPEQAAEYDRHIDQAYTKEDETRQMQQAVAESQQVQYGIIRGSAKGPSDMAYTSSAYGYDVEDDESSTPKGGLMATDEDEFEEIDPRYRIEHSSKFQPGEIFKVYWSEPQGSGHDKHPSVSGRHELENRYGMKFFVGFRRFIVIANDQGHCTCVPILTYGGKACNKHGVKPAKHGIVYEHGHKPHMVSGEPKLGFPPVQATITEDGERLSKESRVNYSKLVTIEHNIRVFFIGSIMPNSLDIIKEAVNDCWYQKNHQRKRS